MAVARRALSQASSAAAAAPRPSPYSIGRAFEERAISLLSATGLDLRATGGAFDGGIDFRGFLGPTGTRRLPVVGQCKAEARKCGARYLRDFEGVLAREARCLGVYVVLAGFSPLAQRHFLGSTWPLLLVRATDRLESLQVNSAAQALVPGLTVGSRVVAGAGAGPALRVPELLFPGATADAAAPEREAAALAAASA